MDAYSAFETRCTGSLPDQSQVAKLLTGKSLRSLAVSLVHLSRTDTCRSFPPSIDHQITSLYVVGLATDFCVRASVLAALKASDHADLHWTTTVVKEGCRGVDAGKSRETLEELKTAGARVVSIEDEEVRALPRS